MKQQRKTTFMEGGNPTLKQAPIFFLILAVFSVELWTFFKNSKYFQNIPIWVSYAYDTWVPVHVYNRNI